MDELLAWDHDAAIAACRRSLADGATIGDVLLRLRATGFSPVDCVRALQTLTGRPSAEMAEVVRRSEVWAGPREHGDLLREVLEKGLAETDDHHGVH